MYRSSRFDRCQKACTFFATLCAAWLCHVALCGAGTSSQQTPETAPSSEARYVMLIEVYVREGEPESDAARQAAQKLAEARPGIQVVTRDIGDKPETRERFEKIVEFYSLRPDQTPVVYGCGRAIQELADDADFNSVLEDLLKIQVFTQDGCTHCAAAHAYLDELSKLYPGLEIVERNITNDLEARELVGELSKELGVPVPSTPIFYVCHQLLVGFEDRSGTDQRMKEILKQWSIQDVSAARTDGGSSF